MRRVFRLHKWIGYSLGLLFFHGLVICTDTSLSISQADGTQVVGHSFSVGIIVPRNYARDVGFMLTTLLNDGIQQYNNLIWEPTINRKSQLPSIDMTTIFKYRDDLQSADLH